MGVEKLYEIQKKFDVKEVELILKNRKRYEAMISELQIEIQDLEDLKSVKLSNIGYDTLVKSDNVITSEQFQLLREVKYDDSIAILEYKKRNIERFLSKIDIALSSLDDIEKRIIELKCVENRIWKSVTFEVNLEERLCRVVKNKGLTKVSNLLKSCGNLKIHSMVL